MSKKFIVALVATIGIGLNGLQAKPTPATLAHLLAGIKQVQQDQDTARKADDLKAFNKYYNELNNKLQAAQTQYDQATKNAQSYHWYTYNQKAKINATNNATTLKNELEKAQAILNAVKNAETKTKAAAEELANNAATTFDNSLKSKIKQDATTVATTDTTAVATKEAPTKSWTSFLPGKKIFGVTGVTTLGGLAYQYGNAAVNAVTPYAQSAVNAVTPYAQTAMSCMPDWTLPVTKMVATYAIPGVSVVAATYFIVKNYKAIWTHLKNHKIKYSLAAIVALGLCLYCYQYGFQIPTSITQYFTDTEIRMIGGAEHVANAEIATQETATMSMIGGAEHVANQAYNNAPFLARIFMTKP